MHEPTATLDRPAYDGGDPIIECSCGWTQDWQHSQSFVDHLKNVGYEIIETPKNKCASCQGFGFHFPTCTFAFPDR